MMMSSKAVDPDVGLAWQLADEVVRLTPDRDRPYRRLYEQIYVAAVLTRAGLADSARHVLERSQGDAESGPPRELVRYVALVRVLLVPKVEALPLLPPYLPPHPQPRQG